VGPLLDYITEQGRLDKKKKHDALYKRYEESQRPSDEFVTDVDRYEAIQTQNATTTFGAMDRSAPVEEDYEYVFDQSTTIAFLVDQDSRIGGTLSAKDAALQAQIDAAERRGIFFSTSSNVFYTYFILTSGPKYTFLIHLKQSLLTKFANRFLCMNGERSYSKQWQNTKF
jgi:hypothetical protein